VTDQELQLGLIDVYMVDKQASTSE